MGVYRIPREYYGPLEVSEHELSEINQQWYVFLLCSVVGEEVRVGGELDLTRILV